MLRRFGCGLALVALMGCAEDELILEGERFGLRDQVSSADAATIATGEIASFAAPAQVDHSAWTHRGGTVTHKITHPALDSSLSQAWVRDIGAGNARKARITADPIVAGGRIFTMDSASRIAATGSDGAALWARSLIPSTEKGPEVSGGGLAFGENTLIATTAFGELFALDATSGEVKWRQKLEAPVTSAPTVHDGLVYVVSRDSRAWALDLAQGRIRWQITGTPSNANLVGGSGPVVAGRSVVFPFGSGELVAALAKSGIRVWGSSVAGQRRGRAYASISDISGDPVVHDGKIYAANQAGRAVALNAASGERLWSANEGAYSPMWPAGDSVFLISEQAELIRLDAESGARIWAIELPYFVKQRLKRRKAVFAHFGPVLAGGRLIVASDDGVLRQFDPETGEALGEVAIPGGAASNPVVVDGTLYVVTAKGQLAAFR